MSLQTRILRYLKDQADHRLLPFHREFIRGAYDPSCQIAAASYPRGAAKTWLSAQLLACSLRPRSPLFRAGIENLAISASLEQSRVLVTFVRQILEPLGGYVFVDSSQRLQVRHKATNTKLRVLSSSGKRALGLSQFQAIYGDEPGSWESRNGLLVWDALRTSLGKLPGQKLILTGTQAPADLDSWWPNLLSLGSGPGRYVQVLAADPSEPWDAWPTIYGCNPMVWSNPHLRKTILRERDEARKDETLRASFKAFRLNQLVNVNADMLLSVADWKRVEQRPVPPREGRPICGLDLGAERSWSAAFLVWKNGRSECYALCPGIPSLSRREQQDAQPRGLYRRLHADGHLLVDEGRRVSRPKVLTDHLKKVGIRPTVVFCDRFQLGTLKDAVTWPIQPRTARWSEATEDISSFRRIAKDGPLAIEKKSRPLARLGLSQATVETDSQGSIRMKKRRADRSRDDVAVSAVLASGGLVRALSRPQAPRWRYRGRVQ